MIFHSVIPYECIFCSNNDEVSSKNKNYTRTITEYKGITMEVSLLDDGKKRIERLYSTNPELYLDKRFCIGTIIGES